MNDTELDLLLDTWEAPLPAPSLRAGLRARFPRPEPRRSTRPLRWVLAIAVASATLAIGMEQSGTNPWDFRLVRAVNRLYEDFVQALEAWRASGLVARIRQSDPKVYVDGRQVGPLGYGHAATMEVQVPGEGRYSIISFPGLTGWIEAGHIHGSVIEFQAGSKHVRIECNKPIVDSDRPVFARRW
jgi:hypothetical protein